MKSNRSQHVCPVAKAGHLDSRLRRWLQKPGKILAPYLKPGMTAVDFGCGPGFFTLEMARLVGPKGRVFAVDLQEGMLQKLARKTEGTGLEKRIVLHRCQKDKIGLDIRADFILACYVLHEVRNQEQLWREFAGLLRPGGKLLLAEPFFHVSKRDFGRSLALASRAGMKQTEKPTILLSRTALLAASSRS